MGAFRDTISTESDLRQAIGGLPNPLALAKDIGRLDEHCRAYIAHYELGGGNWLGGEVKKDGKLFAKISYNGRAWEPGNYPTAEIPLVEAVS